MNSINNTTDPVKLAKLSLFGDSYVSYIDRPDHTTHANSLIIDTKDQKEIEVYIFDMNYSQSEYVRGVIHRALEKCEDYYNNLHPKNKIGFKRHLEPDNKEYLVKVITGKTLGFPSTLNLHSTFEYVDGGICASIAYYILILWSRYHYIFGSFPNLIKYIYDIIKKVKLNNNIPDKPSLEVWKILERGVITFLVFTNSLIENDIIKDYIQKKQNDDKKKLTISLNEIIQAHFKPIKHKKQIGGKRTRKTKKVRKHRGIIQTGGNKGKLKKGYKYTGKRLKNGLSEIKKVKAKK
jgi:hypothetical protein